jgi:hypothetical protein
MFFSTEFSFAPYKNVKAHFKCKKNQKSLTYIVPDFAKSKVCEFQFGDFSGGKLNKEKRIVKKSQKAEKERKKRNLERNLGKKSEKKEREYVFSHVSGLRKTSEIVGRFHKLRFHRKECEKNHYNKMASYNFEREVLRREDEEYSAKMNVNEIFKLQYSKEKRFKIRTKPQKIELERLIVLRDSSSIMAGSEFEKWSEIIENHLEWDNLNFENFNETEKKKMRIVINNWSISQKERNKLKHALNGNIAKAINRTLSNATEMKTPIIPRKDFPEKDFETQIREAADDELLMLDLYEKISQSTRVRSEKYIKANKYLFSSLRTQMISIFKENNNRTHNHFDYYEPLQKSAKRIEGCVSESLSIAQLWDFKYDRLRNSKTGNKFVLTDSLTRHILTEILNSIMKLAFDLPIGQINYSLFRENSLILSDLFTSFFNPLPGADGSSFDFEQFLTWIGAKKTDFKKIDNSRFEGFENVKTPSDYLDVVYINSRFEKDRSGMNQSVLISFDRSIKVWPYIYSTDVIILDIDALNFTTYGYLVDGKTLFANVKTDLLVYFKELGNSIIETSDPTKKHEIDLKLPQNFRKKTGSAENLEMVDQERKGIKKKSRTEKEEIIFNSMTDFDFLKKLENPSKVNSDELKVFSKSALDDEEEEEKESNPLSILSEAEFDSWYNKTKNHIEDHFQRNSALKRTISLRCPPDGQCGIHALVSLSLMSDYLKTGFQPVVDYKTRFERAQKYIKENEFHESFLELSELIEVGTSVLNLQFSLFSNLRTVSYFSGEENLILTLMDKSGDGRPDHFDSFIVLSQQDPIDLYMLQKKIEVDSEIFLKPYVSSENYFSLFSTNPIMKIQNENNLKGVGEIFFENRKTTRNDLESLHKNYRNRKNQTVIFNHKKENYQNCLRTLLNFVSEIRKINTVTDSFNVGFSDDLEFDLILICIGIYPIFNTIDGVRSLNEIVLLPEMMNETDSKGLMKFRILISRSEGTRTKYCLVEPKKSEIIRSPVTEGKINSENVSVWRAPVIEEKLESEHPDQKNNKGPVWVDRYYKVEIKERVGISEKEMILQSTLLILSQIDFYRRRNCLMRESNDLMFDRLKSYVKEAKVNLEEYGGFEETIFDMFSIKLENNSNVYGDNYHYFSSSEDRSVSVNVFLGECHNRRDINKNIELIYATNEIISSFKNHVLSTVIKGFKWSEDLEEEWNKLSLIERPLTKNIKVPKVIEKKDYLRDSRKRDYSKIIRSIDLKEKERIKKENNWSEIEPEILRTRYNIGNSIAFLCCYPGCLRVYPDSDYTCHSHGSITRTNFYYCQVPVEENCFSELKRIFLSLKKWNDGSESFFKEINLAEKLLSFKKNDDWDGILSLYEIYKDFDSGLDFVERVFIESFRIEMSRIHKEKERPNLFITESALMNDEQLQNFRFRTKFRSEKLRQKELEREEKEKKEDSEIKENLSPIHKLDSKLETGEQMSVEGIKNFGKPISESESPEKVDEKEELMEHLELPSDCYDSTDDDEFDRHERIKNILAMSRTEFVFTKAREMIVDNENIEIDELFEILEEDEDREKYKNLFERLLENNDSDVEFDNFFGNESDSTEESDCDSDSENNDAESVGIPEHSNEPKASEEKEEKKEKERETDEEIRTIEDFETEPQHTFDSETYLEYLIRNENLHDGDLAERDYMISVGLIKLTENSESEKSDFDSMDEYLRNSLILICRGQFPDPIDDLIVKNHRAEFELVCSFLTISDDFVPQNLKINQRKIVSEQKIEEDLLFNQCVRREVGAVTGINSNILSDHFSRLNDSFEFFVDIEKYHISRTYFKGSEIMCVLNLRMVCSSIIFSNDWAEEEVLDNLENEEIEEEELVEEEELETVDRINLLADFLNKKDLEKKIKLLCQEMESLYEDGDLYYCKIVLKLLQIIYESEDKEISDFLNYTFDKSDRLIYRLKIELEKSLKIFSDYNFVNVNSIVKMVQDLNDSVFNRIIDHEFVFYLRDEIIKETNFEVKQEFKRINGFPCPDYPENCIFILDTNLVLTINKLHTNYGIKNRKIFLLDQVLNELKRLSHSKEPKILDHFISFLSKTNFRMNEKELSNEIGDNSIKLEVMKFSSENPSLKTFFVTNDRSFSDEMKKLKKENLEILDYYSFVRGCEFSTQEFSQTFIDQISDYSPLRDPLSSSVKIFSIKETDSGMRINRLSPNYEFLEDDKALPDFVEGNFQIEIPKMKEIELDYEKEFNSVNTDIDDSYFKKYITMRYQRNLSKFDHGFVEMSKLTVDEKTIYDQVEKNIQDSIDLIDKKRSQKHQNYEKIIPVNRRDHKKSDERFPLERSFIEKNELWSEWMKVTDGSLEENKVFHQTDNKRIKIRDQMKIFQNFEMQTQFDENLEFKYYFDKGEKDFSEKEIDKSTDEKIEFYGRHPTIDQLKRQMDGKQTVKEFENLKNYSLLYHHLIEDAMKSGKLRDNEFLANHCGFVNMGYILPKQKPNSKLSSKVKFRLFFICDKADESSEFHPEFVYSMGSKFLLVSRQYMYENEFLIYRSRLYSSTVALRLTGISDRLYNLIFYCLFFGSQCSKSILSFYKYFNVISNSTYSKLPQLIEKYFKVVPKRKNDMVLLNHIIKNIKEVINENKMHSVIGPENTLEEFLEHNNLYTLPFVKNTKSSTNYMKFYNDIKDNIESKEKFCHPEIFTEDYCEKKHVNTVIWVNSLNKYKNEIHRSHKRSEYEEFCLSEFGAYFMSTSNGIDPTTLRKAKNITIMNSAMMDYIFSEKPLSFNLFEFIDWGMEKCIERGAKCWISIKYQKDTGDREIVIQDLYTKMSHFHIQMYFKFLDLKWPNELVTKSEEEKLKSIQSMPFTEETLFFNDDMAKWSPQDLNIKFRFLVELMFKMGIIEDELIFKTLIKSLKAVEEITLFFDSRISDPDAKYYSRKDVLKTNVFTDCQEVKLDTHEKKIRKKFRGFKTTKEGFSPLLMNHGWPQGLKHFISSFVHGLECLAFRDITNILMPDLFRIIYYLFHSDDKNRCLDPKRPLTEEEINLVLKLNAFVPLTFSLSESKTKPSLSYEGSPLDPKKKISEMVSIYNINGTLLNSFFRQCSTIMTSMGHRSFVDNHLELITRCCTIFGLSNNFSIPEKVYSLCFKELKRLYNYPEEFMKNTINYCGSKDIPIAFISMLGIKADSYYKFCINPKEIYNQLRDPLIPLEKPIDRKFKNQLKFELQVQRDMNIDIILDPKFKKVSDIIERNMKNLFSSSSGAFLSQRDSLFYSFYRSRMEPTFRRYSEIRNSILESREKSLDFYLKTDFSAFRLADVVTPRAQYDPVYDEFSVGSSAYKEQADEILFGDFIVRLREKKSFKGIIKRPSTRGFGGLNSEFRDIIYLVENGIDSCLKDPVLCLKLSNIIRDLNLFKESFSIRTVRDLKMHEFMYGIFKKINFQRKPVLMLFKDSKSFTDLELIRENDREMKLYNEHLMAMTSRIDYGMKIIPTKASGMFLLRKAEKHLQCLFNETILRIRELELLEIKRSDLFTFSRLDEEYEFFCENSHNQIMNYILSFVFKREFVFPSNRMILIHEDHDEDHFVYTDPSIDQVNSFVISKDTIYPSLASDLGKIRKYARSTRKKLTVCEDSEVNMTINSRYSSYKAERGVVEDISIFCSKNGVVNINLVFLHDFIRREVRKPLLFDPEIKNSKFYGQEIEIKDADLLLIKSSGRVIKLNNKKITNQTASFENNRELFRNFVEEVSGLTICMDHKDSVEEYLSSKNVILCSGTQCPNCLHGGSQINKIQICKKFMKYRMSDKIEQSVRKIVSKIDSMPNFQREKFLKVKNDRVEREKLLVEKSNIKKRQINAQRKLKPEVLIWNTVRSLGYTPLVDFIDVLNSEHSKVTTTVLAMINGYLKSEAFFLLYDEDTKTIFVQHKRTGITNEISEQNYLLSSLIRKETHDIKNAELVMYSETSNVIDQICSYYDRTIELYLKNDQTERISELKDRIQIVSFEKIFNYSEIIDLISDPVKLNSLPFETIRAIYSDLSVNQSSYSIEEKEFFSKVGRHVTESYRQTIMISQGAKQMRKIKKFFQFTEPMLEIMSKIIREGRFHTKTPDFLCLFKSRWNEFEVKKNVLILLDPDFHIVAYRNAYGTGHDEELIPDFKTDLLILEKFKEDSSRNLQDQMKSISHYMRAYESSEDENKIDEVTLDRERALALSIEFMENDRDGAFFIDDSMEEFRELPGFRLRKFDLNFWNNSKPFSRFDLFENQRDLKKEQENDLRIKEIEIQLLEKDLIGDASFLLQKKLKKIRFIDAHIFNELTNNSQGISNFEEIESIVLKTVEVSDFLHRRILNLQVEKTDLTIDSLRSIRNYKRDQLRIFKSDIHNSMTASRISSESPLSLLLFMRYLVDYFQKVSFDYENPVYEYKGFFFDYRMMCIFNSSFELFKLLKNKLNLNRVDFALNYKIPSGNLIEEESDSRLLDSLNELIRENLENFDFSKREREVFLSLFNSE